MKKLVMVLLLTLGWLTVVGQTDPVFPYTNPSKETLKKFVSGSDVKSSTYRKYLVETINRGLGDTTLRVSEAEIDFIFDHLYEEEIYLSEEGWDNSGYNTVEKKMIPSIGHKWTGFAWVFRVGSFSIRIIKRDCANVINTPVIRRDISKKDTTAVETKEVSKTVILSNTYNVTNNNFFGVETQPNFQFEEEKESAWDRWLGPTLKWVGIGVGTLSAGYGVYKLCKKRGKPAPAPITPDEGGPGSAPITKGQKELSLSFSFRF